LLTQFAAARAGIILVTINPAYRTSELSHALTLAGCKAVVLAERFKSSDYVQMLRDVLGDARFTPSGGIHSTAIPALRLIFNLPRVRPVRRKVPR
jgi:fatty-acyl-CoA synthase